MTVSINPKAVRPIVGPADAVLFQQAGTLAVSRSAQDKMRDVANVKDFGIVVDGVTDNTARLNSLIAVMSALASPSNGVTLEFPTGVCIANIVMKPRVFLRGQGIGVTVIRSAPASSLPVVSIAATDFLIGWSDITFDGNKSAGCTGHGISFSDASSGTVLTSALWDKTVSGNAPYKFCMGTRFAAVNCGGDGIKIGASTFGNFAVFFDQFHCTRNDGHGFENWSTDNIFSNFYCEHNGNAGLYNRGANNKFIGGKAIFSGEIDPTFAGVDHNSHRCDYIGIEVQDNYCDGAKLQGNDNAFDILADSNGYAPGNTNASARLYAGLRLQNLRRCKLKARVTNYRTYPGRLADGFFPHEWPYVISGINQFEQFDVSIAENVANQGPVGDGPTGGDSTLVVCKRSGSVTQGGITFTADQPAIVDGSGLYLNGAGEQIELAGEIRPGFTLSYAFDFIYDATTTASAPHLIAAEGDAFHIYFVRSGDAQSPGFEVQVKVGGVAKAVRLFSDGFTLAAMASTDLYDGNRFVVAGNLRIQGTSLLRDEVIRCFDSGGLEKQIRSTTTQTVVSGAQFDVIRNPIINNDATQVVIGRCMGVALFTSSVGRGVSLERLPSAGLHKYHDRGGIYACFTSYKAPLRVQRTRSSSMPTAGAFYRGQTLFVEAASLSADTMQVCRKKADDSYEWITSI